MHILITAANSQVGSYLAKKYHTEGHTLSLLYHVRKERIGCLEPSKNVFIEAVDLIDLPQTERVINNSISFHGSFPEVLIHCAARRSYDAKPLADTNPPIFKEVLCTNVLQAYNVLRAMLPVMRNNEFGRVVLFGSNVTLTGLPNGSAYAAAKSAIANLTKSIALENADIDFLISCISPAPVETILEEDFHGEYLQFRKEYFAKYLDENPGASLVSKEEIKQVIDMILSAKDLSISGKEIFLGNGVN